MSDEATQDAPPFADSPVAKNLDALLRDMPSLGYQHAAITAVQLYRQAAESAWYEATSRYCNTFTIPLTVPITSVVATHVTILFVVAALFTSIATPSL